MSPSENLFYTPPQNDDSVGSLSDYIAKHLQNRDNGAVEPVSSAPVFVSAPAEEVFLEDMVSREGYRAFRRERHKDVGRVLHHLDTNLVMMSVEKNVAAESTRYQLKRDRLKTELNGIYEDLRRYYNLQNAQNAMYKNKIDALENRADLLKRKIFALDQKLAQCNPLQSIFQRIQSLTPGVAKQAAAPLPPSILRPAVKENLKTQIHHVHDELESLQQLMETQLHDACFSPDQLGRLVNQYDANLKKAEHLLDDLKKASTFKNRLANLFSFKH